MDEQNTGVETTQETVQTPAAADTTAGQQTPGEAQVTEQASDSPKEDKRDWEGYARKLEQERKSLREMLKEQQAQTPPQTQSVQPPVGDESVQQGLELLRSTIREELMQTVGPIMEDRIWQDFESKPYAKELTPEIHQELQQVDRMFGNLPLEQRLEMARTQAIAKNLDTIIKVNREMGVEQGYNAKNLKKSQQGLGESPSGAAQPQTPDILERAKTMSTDEYMAHYSEIQDARRKQLGL